MSQIFRPSANSYARGSIVGLLVLLGTLGITLDRLSRSPYVTRADTVREQPVQFSHQHHAGGLGIDCRFCHTSVESAPSAGIPPTKTCMNCHSQIWLTSPYLEIVRASFRDDKPLHWTRVHDLPDFVYFNHSVHVAKGVGCVTCHGRVDRMPLMLQKATLQMGWCLDCHRNPAKYVRPRDKITDMEYQASSEQQQLEMGRRLVKEYQIQSLTSCSTCHR
jgi:hypothetical protein